MMLMCRYFDAPVDFTNKNVKILAIENKELFRKVITSLHNENEDEFFVFSEDYKPLSFKKFVRFLDALITFSFADKKMMTKVLEDFDRMSNIKYAQELWTIRQGCVDLCEKLAQEYEYDFDFCDEIESLALIKLFNFTPRDDTSSFVEKLTRYFKLMRKYIGIRCFVIMNMHMYLTDEEIAEICSFTKQNEICVLDIETTAPQNVLRDEQLIIIDKDLCTMLDK